jgi:cytochrome b subunit of formate dehydrogenase
VPTEKDFDPLLKLPEVPTYHGLHAVYAVVVLALVATGLLIQHPDLRAALAGGYGRTFATVHEWAGVAMLALPAVALVLSPRKAIDVIEIRSYQRRELRLHAVNLWFTLLGGAGLIVTGFLMWFPSVPYAILDTSADMHSALSYALCVMIPLHLLAARRRIVLAIKEFMTS